MKLKRALSFVLSALIMASALTACGGNPSAGSSGAASGSASASSQSPAANSGKTEISFWTLDTRQKAVDDAVKEFEAKNPDITVKVSYASTDGQKQNLKVAASSNTLPSMWFNWGGSLGGYYSDNGLTYDLTQYAKDNGWDKKFQLSALQLCTRSNQLTGYPTSLNMLGIFYRKDIFQKYNISVPKTFDEFEQACATLKKNGVTPMSAAGKNGWHVMRWVEALVEHFAGPVAHDSLDTFNTSWAGNPAVIQALNKYKEFADKGYFPKGFVTANPDDARLNIYSGSAAMDIEGEWLDSQIVGDKQNMDLYGYFPFPAGGTNRMSAFAEMTQFNKNLTKEQLDACVKFTEFYNSDEIANKYPDCFNLPLPVVGAAVPSTLPHIGTMLSDMNKNGIFTITDQCLPTEVADALFKAQDSIATGGMTADQGAKSIQDAIDKYKAANE
jgi:ABC-type sugar transport system, periplasmic component